jgi:hypothetical protein
MSFALPAAKSLTAGWVQLTVGLVVLEEDENFAPSGIRIEILPRPARPAVTVVGVESMWNRSTFSKSRCLKFSSAFGVLKQTHQHLY